MRTRGRRGRLAEPRSSSPSSTGRRCGWPTWATAEASWAAGWRRSRLCHMTTNHRRLVDCWSKNCVNQRSYVQYSTLFTVKREEANTRGWRIRVDERCMAGASKRVKQCWYNNRLALQVQSYLTGYPGDVAGPRRLPSEGPEADHCRAGRAAL